MIPNLKYKTTLCENWIQSINNDNEVGNCYKGNNCHFAHGEQELRSIADVRFILFIYSFLSLTYFLESKDHRLAKFLHESCNRTDNFSFQLQNHQVQILS